MYWNFYERMAYEFFNVNNMDKRLLLKLISAMKINGYEHYYASMYVRMCTVIYLSTVSVMNY